LAARAFVLLAFVGHSAAPASAVIPTGEFPSDAAASGDESVADLQLPLVVGGSDSGIGPGPVAGIDLAGLVGADRFYSAGITGSNSIVTVSGGGYAWNSHETLQHVQLIPHHFQALGEVNRSDTWIAMLIGGRLGGANPGRYQLGLAPDAQLYSGAFAGVWSGERGRAGFYWHWAAFDDTYRRASLLPLMPAGRPADVVNSGWTSLRSDPFGPDPAAETIDGIAIASPRTLQVAPVRHVTGSSVLAGPATGFNLLRVAPLTVTSNYEQPAATALPSLGHFYDWEPDWNGTWIENVRTLVDLAAPGDGLTAAYYGGETGGNGLTPSVPQLPFGPPYGPPDGPPGGPDYYQRGLASHSLASAMVSGGAALLYDAAHTRLATNPDAADSRVIKAVLLNSADKTVGWNNHQVPHPNGLGGVQTDMALDDRVGAGRMNLDRAFDQFLSGTTDVPGTSLGNQGIVRTTGWDFGLVANGTTNDYYLDEPLAAGTIFNATLNWFHERTYLTYGAVVETLRYANLDLELWSVAAGAPQNQIAASVTLYNNIEHFSFPIRYDSDYVLRVRWLGEYYDFISESHLRGPDEDFYGLAWSATVVPEPPTAGLAVGALLACCLVAIRHRRRK
jgi:hypothetical protein